MPMTVASPQPPMAAGRPSRRALVRSVARDARQEPLGDSALVRLSQSGDHAAFDALVRRHRARALRVARRQLRNPSAATDMVQQAFLLVLEALPRYEERGSFAAYLCTVVLNLCRMDNRAFGARTRLLDSFRLYREAATVAVADRDAALAVGRSLEQLSERLRQVVLLRYFAGLSHEEIAEVLEVPVGTVRRRHFDAMAKLLQLLEA